MASFIVIDKLRLILENINDDSSVNDVKLVLGDFISKYDELYRLFKWRESKIESGIDLDKYDLELRNIETTLIKEGFYISDDKKDSEIRLMFSKVK